MDKDLLLRIAEALERLAPAVDHSPMPDAPAFVWQAGQLAVAQGFRPVALDLLAGVASQKAAVLENSQRLAAGHAAHDILLWGARGSGKSALVKSTSVAVQAGKTVDGLRQWALGVQQRANHNKAACALATAAFTSAVSARCNWRDTAPVAGLKTG